MIVFFLNNQTTFSNIDKFFIVLSELPMMKNYQKTLHLSTYTKIWEEGGGFNFQKSFSHTVRVMSQFNAPENFFISKEGVLTPSPSHNYATETPITTWLAIQLDQEIKDLNENSPVA